VSKDGNEAGGEKKSKKGLFIAVGVVVLVAGAGGGLLFGPKLLGDPPAAEAHEGKGKSEKGEKHEGGKKEKEAAEKLISSKFEAIIVDLRDNEGTLRHLKVGLAAEISELLPEEEFKLRQPRGREAAIAYLRTLTFDQATDPKRYPKVKKDLSKKVLAALDSEHIHRLLIIDYVAQ
jgi:flagellar basal body-associated protein FliL